MEKLQLAIGRLLLVGVLFSFAVVMIGGGAYLLRHGMEIANYQSFHGEPQAYKSIADIFSDALTLSSLAIIQLGLLILVIVQILRVGMTAWLFMQSKERLFFYISLFILLVLVYSLFWKF